MQHHGCARPYAVWRSHQHIERPDGLLLQPKCLTNAPLDAIAHHRFPSMFARHQGPKARRAFRTLRKIEGIPGQAATHTPAQQPLEVRTARKSPIRSQSEPAPCPPCTARGGAEHSPRRPTLHRQPVASARTPGADHCPSGTRAHAHEEPVTSGAPRLGRLIGSFHCWLDPKRAVLEPAPVALVKSSNLSLQPCG